MASATTDTLRRLEDFDRRYLRQNLMVACANVPISAIASLRYGWWLLFFGSLPLVSAALGLVWLRERIGLVWWHAVHLSLVAVATAGGALTTGGTASPIFQLVPIVGLVWVSYFPERTASLLAAPLTSLAVISIDGDWSDWLAVSVSLMNSVLIPLFALRLVDSELHHRRRAVIDELTGCLNRHAFTSRKAELDAQIDRTGDPVGVVVFDIDHFKQINDAHGHATGDRALAALADRVRASLRGFELFYRLGGEEFVLLLPGASLEDSARISETVRQAVHGDLFDDIAVTISCGIAQADAATPLDEAVLQADIALYEAKRTGRDRSVVATG